MVNQHWNTIPESHLVWRRCTVECIIIPFASINKYLRCNFVFFKFKILCWMIVHNLRQWFAKPLNSQRILWSIEWPFIVPVFHNNICIPHLVQNLMNIMLVSIIQQSVLLKDLTLGILPQAATIWLSLPESSQDHTDVHSTSEFQLVVF